MGPFIPIDLSKKIIILFDGVCNLCNGAVQFIIKRDPNNRFVFASLQSAFGKSQLVKAGLDPLSLHSILVIDQGLCYQRSDAALIIVENLNGFWSYFSVLSIVPKVLRDGVYTIIARYRYRFFGKKDQCMIPTAAIKARFIDSLS